MTDATEILSRARSDDRFATDQLLNELYHELRVLAAAKLAMEQPGQTLQATALVHEAYVRVVNGGATQKWDSRGHFFGAAAEAMRRILIERARKKQSIKGGGKQKLAPRDQVEASSIAVEDDSPCELLALDEALTLFEAEEPIKAKLVKLRYFAGASLEQAAEILEISPSTAKRYWVYARAWLFEKLKND